MNNKIVKQWNRVQPVVYKTENFVLFNYRSVGVDAIHKKTFFF